MQPWHWQDPLLLRSIHPWCHGRPPPPWERFPIWKCDHLSPLLNPKNNSFWDLDHPQNLEDSMLGFFAGIFWKVKCPFFWILISMSFQGSLIILHQAENGRGSKLLDPKWIYQCSIWSTLPFSLSRNFDPVDFGWNLLVSMKSWLVFRKGPSHNPYITG